jgi:hypothetical protein
MIECFLMLVELTQDRTKLKMTLAQVPQFEKLAANVEFLCCLYDVLHLHVLLILALVLINLMILFLRLLLLLHIEHLLYDALVLIEIRDFSLQVIDSAVEVRGTVLKHTQPKHKER